jgi:hypothetical protein
MPDRKALPAGLAQEWFLVTPPPIKEVAGKNKDQWTSEFRYDPETASLHKIDQRPLSSHRSNSSCRFAELYERSARRQAQRIDRRLNHRVGPRQL